MKKVIGVKFATEDNNLTSKTYSYYTNDPITGSNPVSHHNLRRNKMADSATITGGIGFPGLLTILFIALKLTDKIDWSWWWVLSPLWISSSIVIAILIAVFGFAMLMDR
jgi:hypothetical protein